MMSGSIGEIFSEIEVGLIYESCFDKERWSPQKLLLLRNLRWAPNAQMFEISMSLYVKSAENYK